MFAGTVGCASVDAPTGNAMRAANTSVTLVASARKHCPGATAAIEAAEAAGAAARKASDASNAAGKKLDALKKDYSEASSNADQANSRRSAAQSELNGLQAQMDAADAEWKAANEEWESYQVQAAAAGIDTTDANLNGALDKMKAGLEVPLALANAANAKAKRNQFEAKHQANKKQFGGAIKAKQAEVNALAKEAVSKQNERDRIGARADAAKAEWEAAIQEASDKTIAARNANSALAAACPEAANETYPQDTRLPGNQPPGLDTFSHTTGQHQEPGGGGMGGGTGHHHEK
jgi:chromosome segregation ATPase